MKDAHCCRDPPNPGRSLSAIVEDVLVSECGTGAEMENQLRRRGAAYQASYITWMLVKGIVGAGACATSAALLYASESLPRDASVDTAYIPGALVATTCVLYIDLLSRALSDRVYGGLGLVGLVREGFSKRS